MTQKRKLGSIFFITEHEFDAYSLSKIDSHPKSFFFLKKNFFYFFKKIFFFFFKKNFFFFLKNFFFFLKKILFFFGGQKIFLFFKKIFWVRIDFTQTINKRIHIAL